jgi:branched-chain amino acid transport system permease protein
MKPEPTPAEGSRPVAAPRPVAERLRRGLRRSVRTLTSPTYLIALGVITFFAYWASGSPTSFFALSLVYASIYITLALAWDFSSGLTGYLNFGLPFFFGLGAFTTGYLSWHGNRQVPELLLASFGVGLLAGLLFSLPTLRLRGPYFTLLSLLLPLIGADFIIAFWTQLHLPTEGFEFLPFLASTPGAELVLLSVVNGVLLTGFLLLRDSHFGLVLRGIRDDEEALGAQGIWTFPYKVVAFTLASGVVAFSGASYALTITYGGVDTFDFVFILFPVLIVILGGTGEIAGSVLAGYLVILLYQYMSPILSTLTFIIFSTIAILLILFLPGGLMKQVRAFVRFMRTAEPA